MKTIKVELTEREIEILQAVLHNKVASIYTAGGESVPICIEVLDLSSRIDSIYVECF